MIGDIEILSSCADPGTGEVMVMGYPILDKRGIGPQTWLFKVHAPMVAHGRQPGQFFMAQPSERSERIPLTLAGGSREEGWIRFVVQEVGCTSKAIAALKIGEELFAVAGPMGAPTKFPPSGTVVLVAGGYGSAAILPAAEMMHARGQRVIVILGGRSADRVLLAQDLGGACQELIITTDDGSWGRRGIVTEALRDVLEREPIAQVLAVGPVPMMAAVSELTQPYGIHTEVSLNALMVDGTGMCGACRVTVDGETRFACMEGPDFNGHLVDFAELRARQAWYKKEEALVQEPVDACVFEHRRSEGVPGPGKAELDWSAVDLGAIKPSQKRLIPRQEAACQPPEVRRQNFSEVSLGLSAEQAKLEAARCLDCKIPYCVEGCPVAIDIPGFLKQIVAGDVLGAAATIKLSSSLPAVCGRVCPQEKQCEKVCVVGIKGESVAIGRLERYAADIQLAAGIAVPPKLPESGRSVGVVGAGPAGLTVAGELILKGHRVTVYEALYKPGGVLLYGIPEFRLPNAIVDQEVEVLKKLGVEFVCNTIVGRSITVDELKARHDALFLGTGAGLPKMLGVPGENFKGVYTANEFLTRVNLMRADLFPSHTTPVTVGKRVVVVGCGDTAMDASRTSIRLGPESVHVIYRRTRAEATARMEEFDHAVEEGIVFQWLRNPVRILGNAEGWATGVECAVMALGEPGSDGRRAVADTGEREIIPCDTVITALGFGVNPTIPNSEPRLKTNKWGIVVVDEATGETSMPGIYAGGDLITGGATVILAMGQGRRAAAAMHEHLMREEAKRALSPGS